MNNLQTAQARLDRELIIIVRNTTKKKKKKKKVIFLALKLCIFVTNQIFSKKGRLIA